MARRGSSGGARSPRASSSAAKAQKQFLPSSEELLNLVGSRPVAAAVGEFGGLSEIANEYYKPKKYRNLAGEAVGLYTGAETDELDITGAYDPNAVYEYIDGRGNLVDTSVFRPIYDIDEDTGEMIVPGFQGPKSADTSYPAPISVVPTSTINPERPRTVAAGYDPEREVLTVVFRDGTWYNYYEVTVSEWKAFKAAVSKGRFIYKILDFKPRGEASTKGIAAGVRKNLYAISRAAQVGYKGKQKGIGKIK